MKTYTITIDQKDLANVCVALTWSIMEAKEHHLEYSEREYREIRDRLYNMLNQ